MEYIDLYDMHRIPTGKTILRGSPVPEGMYRVVVHICIFNSKGEMLIQQRQSTKKHFPDMWDISVGGQVSSGETSELAAQREIYEELGLDIDMSDMRPLASMSFRKKYSSSGYPYPCRRKVLIFWLTPSILPFDIWYVA